jgi:hypothetical protein
MSHGRNGHRDRAGEQAAQRDGDPSRDRERCPVPRCGGVLEFDVELLGRIAVMGRAYQLGVEAQQLLARAAARCPECARRADLEYRARFGPHLAELHDREAARAAVLRSKDAAGAGEPLRCTICSDVLKPNQLKVCSRVACRRAYKAQYQRAHFGRDDPPDAPPTDQLSLDP